jgi:proteasome lid subunit RPN8/RPN11
MSADKPAVDASSIPVDGLARKEFGPPKRGPFRVKLKPGVHGAVWGHGKETLDRELCGVLLGRVFRDDAGPFLEVEDWVRGEHARSDGAQVTFTHETWDYIHEEIRKRHPKEPPDIVGWYHTHPGFGIFLSEMDLFIHSNFFSAPTQVALVLDPRTGEEGMFGWVEGKVARLPGYFVGDAEKGGPARGSSAAAGAAGADVPPPRPRDADEIDVAGFMGRIRTGTVLALLWGLLLGWVAAQFMLSWQARSYVLAAAEAEVGGLVRSGILVDAQEKELREIEAKARALAEGLPADGKAAALALAEDADRGARLAAERHRAVNRALQSQRLVMTTGELAARVDMQSRQVQRLQALVQLFAVAPAWAEMQRALEEKRITPEQAEPRIRALRETVARDVMINPDLEAEVRAVLPGLLPDRVEGKDAKKEEKR